MRPSLRRRGAQAEAHAAATARWRQLWRSTARLYLILTRGNPQLLAGRRIKLVDFNVNLNGLWTISSIEHRIDAAGYVTSLEADSPKPGA